MGVPRRSWSPESVHGTLALALAGLATLAALYALPWRWSGTHLLLCWLLSVNLVTFGYYGYDKRCARQQGRRVPESVLHDPEHCRRQPRALGGHADVPPQNDQGTLPVRVLVNRLLAGGPAVLVGLVVLASTVLTLGSGRSLIPFPTSPKRSAGCYPAPHWRLGLVAGSAISHKPQAQARGAAPTPRWRLGLVAGSAISHKPQAPRGVLPHPALALGACGGRDRRSLTSPKRQRGVLPPPRAGSWGLWRDQRSLTSPKRQRGVLPPPRAGSGACGRDRDPPQAPSAARGATPTPRWLLGLVAGSAISHKPQAPARGATPPRAGSWGLWRDQRSLTSPKRQRGVLPPPRAGSWGLWRAGSAIFHLGGRKCCRAGCPSARHEPRLGPRS